MGIVENFTNWEDELFEDAELENHAHSTVYLSIFTLILVVIRMLMGLISVTIDIFLIVSVLKYKMMRTYINIFIVHFSIIDILYFICYPGIQLLFEGNPINMTSCIMYQIQIGALLFNFLIKLALLLHWFLQVYKYDVLASYSKYLHYIFLLFYVLLIAWTSLHGYRYCQQDEIKIENFWIRVAYVVVVLVLIIINLYIWKNKSPYESSKHKYILTVVNYSVFLWFMSFLSNLLFDEFYMYSNILTEIIKVTSVISTFIAYCTTPVILYVLQKNDKYYKMALMRCSRQNVYEDELEVVSEVEEG